MWAKFSKLALIKNKLRTSCGQERLKKSVERDIVQQIDTGRVRPIDRFDGDNRRLALKWPCHFMGNQVCKFVIFFMYTFLWCMPAFVNMFVVPPGWKSWWRHWGPIWYSGTWQLSHQLEAAPFSCWTQCVICPFSGDNWKYGSGVTCPESRYRVY